MSDMTTRTNTMYIIKMFKIKMIEVPHLKWHIAH